jgi:Family of unknown function (DUF5908)
MALEIREIEIRMRVGAEGGDAPVTQLASSEAGECCDGSTKAEIVDECVRRVLQALKTRGER